MQCNFNHFSELKIDIFFFFFYFLTRPHIQHFGIFICLKKEVSETCMSSRTLINDNLFFGFFQGILPGQVKFATKLHIQGCLCR